MAEENQPNGVAIGRGPRSGRRKRWIWALLSLTIIGAGLVTAYLPGILDTSRPGRSYNESVPPRLLATTAMPGRDVLTQTDIMLTADQPLTPGRNAVWCGSFIAGWQEMKRAAGGPVMLEGASEVCDRLNALAPVADDLPPGGSYAASGIYSEVWAQQVRDAVARKITHEAVPEFPGATPGLPISYACLYARLRFGTPYFDWREPMPFGGTTVAAFGIQQEREYAYYPLRKQIAVLYNSYDPLKPENYDSSGRYIGREAFAVDLDASSSPDQLIVAKVPHGRSLEDTWAQLAAQIQEHSKREAYYKEFGPRDVLSVPNLNIDIWHEFSQISGRKLMAGSGAGLPARFLQEIRFRLDRSGSELWSQTPNPCSPIPMYYIFKDPFLIVMKQRNSEHPYLMIWVENPELLQSTAPAGSGKK